MRMYGIDFFVFVTSKEVQNIFSVDALKLGVWRAFMKEESKWTEHVCKRNVKGNPKNKHWSDDYPEFWPRREGWRSKQNNVIQKNGSQ